FCCGVDGRVRMPHPWPIHKLPGAPFFRSLIAEGWASHPLALDLEAGQPCYFSAPWHFLNFFPLPQGHGSLRPTFSPVRRCVGWLASPPPAIVAASSSRCFLRWHSFSSASIVVDGCRVGIEISLGSASSVIGRAALATGG